MSSGTDLEETIQDSDPRPLHETGSCLRIPPPAIPKGKGINLYTRGLLAGIGILGLYLTLQSGSKMITDIRIRRIESYYGEEKAIDYAQSLWKEIHPQEETFIGNVLHSGKKSAVLEYLGYRKLNGE